MVSAQDLHAALAKVEDTRRQVTALSRAKPDGWKTDYARLRPVLQDAIAELGRFGDIWYARNGKPGEAKAFAEVIATALAKVRQHQARWPVLVIDSANPDYLASIREVDARFAEIVSFIRTSDPR